MIKYLKYFLKFLGGILILLLLLLVSLRLPYVQTKLAQIATDFIAKKTNTVLTIDKVAINFIDNVSLKGIYAEDLNKDTLLYAGNINVDIGIFNLFRNKVDIENINLDNITAHIYQKEDSTFNFQFLIDAFASQDTTKNNDNTASSLEIIIGQINIENANISFDLLNGKNSAKFKQLLVKANTLDFEQLIFDLNKIKIVDAKIETHWQESIDEDTTEFSGFPLNELPISILCDNVSIENSDVLFTLGKTQNTAYFEANYINVKALNFEAKNILVNNTAVKIDVKNLAGNLNNKISIQKTKGEILFGEKGIFAENFVLETEKTKAKLDAKLTYQEFDELLNLSSGLGTFLEVDKLELAINELVYFVPQLAEIDQFKNNINETLYLTTEINGTLESIYVNALKAEISETKINFSGNIKNAIDYENIELDKTKVIIATNIKDLEKFIGKEYIKKEYNHFGNLDLNSDFNGTLKSLNINNLTLATDGLLKLKIKGKINELLDIDKLTYAVNITNIETGISDLKVFADSLPEMLDEVKLISYKGFLKGDVNTYNLKGTLNTNLGAAKTDLLLDFNEKFSNASYKGNIEIDNFDIGQLLQNDSVGKISLIADVNGEGLSLDSLNVVLDATVKAFEFKNYNYKNLTVSGTFIQQKFDGKAAIKDENLDFNFAGLIDFNDSIPIINFKANLDKFYAKNLNLLGFPLYAKLKIDANLKGITAEDIAGEISIRDIYLENGKNTWQSDSILFIADKTDVKNRKLTLKSDIVNVNLVGNYSFATLPQIFIAFGDEYFPFSTLIAQDSVKVNKSLKDEYIDVQISIKNLMPLANLLEIKLEKFDSAALSFNLDAPNKLANFQFFIPEIQYDGIYADSIYMTASSKNDEALIAKLRIDSINYNDIAYIPDLEFNGNFFEQKAQIGAIIKNSAGKNSLKLNTALEKNNNDLSMQIVAPFVLNEKEWQLIKNNKYLINPDKKDAFVLEIKKDNETLNLNNSEDLFNVVFANFELANIINLVQIDSTEIKGAINGNISLGNAESQGLNTDLSIGNIRFNNVQFGDLTLVASQLKEKVNAALSLIGNNNDIDAKANFNIESGQTEGYLNIAKFSMATLEPIVKNYAKNISGSIFGKIDFNGIREAQNINGNLVFKEVKAFVVPLGTNYEITKGTVNVKKDKLSPDLELKDLDNNYANLKGSVGHDYFTDFVFDLNFTSDKFTFLNSKYDSESLFYGKVIASTKLQITGDLDMPKIRGSITANDGSDLTIQLISPKIAASEEAYIVFVDGEDLSFDEIETIANERYKTETSVDVDIVFNISEKTNLKLIIDPLTGDNLQLNGNARLAIKVPPYGDIDINGSYTVTQGSYRFSFQQVLRKKFEIVSGSSINFTGNPLDASLNLKAAYKTNISTYSLVAEQSATLSDEEKIDLKKKTEAQVLLEIEGKIIEPKLSFDIVLDENNNSPVGSSVTRALNNIKQNESELNKQVFSLLLFNSFSTSQSSTNISSTGTSTAARSVGNLINTQLNKLTNNVNGLQLNFDLDQYENQLSESGDQITEIDLGLSQSLLDDRLTISLDGNVGLESGSDNAFSSIAGNFVLAYNITKDGKYKVRVFQKSDFDALNNSNVWKTGFGFSYQAEFGNLKKIGQDEK